MAERRSAIEPVADQVVTASTCLPISPPESFAYFTRNVLLQSWLAPVTEVEAKVGGRYELFWEPDDRENNSTIGCRVTAVAAGQVLAFQWRSPKQFKPFANVADPLTHVVVAFAPDPSGTWIHLIHSGWRSSPEWAEARAWQEKAWEAAFAELERVVKQR